VLAALFGPMTTSTFLVAWAIAATASILVFLHANKTGSRHATAWGAGVFLFMGFVLPVYAIHYLVTRRRRGDQPGRRY
jgi:hypothetical protein